jgi:hypothetical protein
MDQFEVKFSDEQQRVIRNAAAALSCSIDRIVRAVEAAQNMMCPGLDELQRRINEALRNIKSAPRRGACSTPPSNGRQCRRR